MRLSAVFAVLLLLALLGSAAWLLLAWPWPWADLWRNPDSLPLAQAAVQMSVIPQMAVAVLAGGLLSVSSVALQQIVRNPLASEGTLSIAGGAQLALMLVNLVWPAAGLLGNFWVALVGGSAAMGLVLLIAAANRMNPLAMILGGLIVNLVLGSVAALLHVFYSQLFMNVAAWGSGSLLQDGWDATVLLSATAAVVALCFLLLHRPLTLLALDDEQARRLGAPVALLRFLVLLLAVGAAAMVVSRIGVIAFIGLMGASVVNLLRVRHLHQRLLLAFVAGGLLLLALDNTLNIIGHFSGMILPSGTMTGVLGVPLLVYLLLAQRKTRRDEVLAEENRAVLPRLQSWRLPVVFVVLLMFLLIVLQGFSAHLHGWGWLWDGTLILEHRLPRSLSAMATGALLAVGGALLQILTRNPMASPEVLGVSSGAALAVVSVFIIMPGIGSGGLLLAGSLGSFAVLLLVMWLSRHLAPPFLLLVGVAISALVQGVVTLLQLSGNPAITAVLSWLSGSTYYARPHTVWLLLAAAVLLLAGAQLMARPLRLLSLGSTVAGGLGLAVRTAESVLLLLVAMISAISTLAVGPLSFIGLMSPHLARRLGAVTPDRQLPVAALLGAGLMLLADWLGRYLVFPYEIGAGVIAALLGGVYFLLLIRQRPSY